LKCFCKVQGESTLAGAGGPHDGDQAAIHNPPD
jgi:hypothetical protein